MKKSVVSAALALGVLFVVPVGGRPSASSGGSVFARVHELLHAVIWHRPSCAR